MNIKVNTIPAQTFIILILLCNTLNPAILQSQSITDSFPDRFLMHFEQSSDKLIQLAEAMPEETYNWSPDGEAMPTGQVFMHIARYNYMLLSNFFGIELPDGVNPETLEELRDKETVIEVLNKSIDFVNRAIPQLTEEELLHPIEFFGGETERWAVLFMLITHKGEHLGQAISYARMNGIVPPWSN